jgi:hypothetical protein
MHRIGLQNCPYCGSLEVYASKPKTIWDRVLAIFLARLVRCHTCMRRHYRPFSFPIAIRPVGQRFQKKAQAIPNAPERKDRSA